MTQWLVTVVRLKFAGNVANEDVVKEVRFSIEFGQLSTSSSNSTDLWNLVISMSQHTEIVRAVLLKCSSIFLLWGTGHNHNLGYNIFEHRTSLDIAINDAFVLSTISIGVLGQKDLCWTDVAAYFCAFCTQHEEMIGQNSWFPNGYVEPECHKPPTLQYFDHPLIHPHLPDALDIDKECVFIYLYTVCL